jgi:DNA-binding NtrC family response regulator
VRPIPVDVRVVAGTKRDLQQMVAEGTFREDLYYRLNVLSLSVPPLRERREDLPVLVEHFLAKFFGRRGLDPPPMSDGVMMALRGYDWPGNVRELENTCERIAESCSCGHVRVGCLGASVLFPAMDLSEPLEIGGPAAARTTPLPGRVVDLPDHAADVRDVGTAGFSLDERLRRIEAEIIRAALEQAGGNKSRAAALLGVKRSTLGDRISKCGVE